METDKSQLQKMGVNLRDYYFKNKKEIDGLYLKSIRGKRQPRALHTFVREMFKVAVAMGWWTPRRGPKPNLEGSYIVQL